MRVRVWGINLMLICILAYGYHAMPEYKIKNDMSFIGPSGRHTIVKVIIYKNHYAQELPEKIEKFFVNLNGEPTSLQIDLYIPGESKPYKSVHFEY